MRSSGHSNGQPQFFKVHVLLQTSVDANAQALLVHEFAWLGADDARGVADRFIDLLSPQLQPGS